jgi:hypothetical protein
MTWQSFLQHCAGALYVFAGYTLGWFLRGISERRRR